jgi:hypothetical protein
LGKWGECGQERWELDFTQRIRAVQRGTEELQLKSLPLRQLQENFADSFLSFYSFRKEYIQKPDKMLT